MHNVLERTEVPKLLQVGLRDLCQEEFETIENSKGRIQAVFDHQWASLRLAGANLREFVVEQIEQLPHEVYISFDIDGLDPSLCPNTGTPVPGGLLWPEAMLWLEELVRSGRHIVGFDLCEVSPGQGRPPGEGWDEIVGARLLYRLIGFALMSTKNNPA
jgi:agmatinase